MEKIVLRDEATESLAEILVGFGFNCYRFRAGGPADGLEVIWADSEFDVSPERPSGSGIPILFPFPGRIRGTTLSWDGQEYALPERDRLGNAIHGFVHDRPWRVLQQQEEHVMAEFQASIDDPSLAHRWPADFRITATYGLSGNRLECRYFVENPDVKPLPCGLGTHPYFRVPLGDVGKAEKCWVRVPVSHSWELVDMSATGRKLPVEGHLSLSRGVRFDQMTYDDVFGGLSFDEGWCRTTIEDQQSGRAVELAFDEAFRECVVYNPPHREAVCIEPYTCVPDCFRLEAEGIDAGMRVLEPGDGFTARVVIGVKKI